MRILIHMGDPYPNEGPNAKRMRTFYEALCLKGHSVKVLAPTYQNVPEDVEDVIYCKAPPLTSKSSLNRLINQIGIGFATFFASFRVGKTDVVITTSPPALISPFGWLIAKVKKAKLVYDVRDIWPDVAWEMGSFSQDSLYSKVFAGVRNFMLKHADLVTAVSMGKVEKLESYCPTADVVYITNGLDEKFLENEDNQEVVDRYQLDKVFSCVYIGNLGMAQGLGQLLSIAEKAAQEKIPAQFLLFGSGVEENQLKTYVKEHNLDNVHFPGRLPNKDMYAVLKHTKMSYVSLVNEKLTDSVPTKLYEALGVGCPVLLSAAGEAVDILRESGLGLAVMPNDEEGLWRAFLSMHSNIEEYDNGKENARKLMCSKYSRQQAALHLEQALSMRFVEKKAEV